MLISRKKLIELCATSDETRPHLRHPHLDVENSVMVATDGKLMVVVKVEVEKWDVSGPVSRQALRLARAGKSDACGKVTLRCGEDTIELASGIKVPRYGGNFGGKGFPDWQEVVKPTKQPTILVAFDMKLLSNLCRALDARMAYLEIVPNADPNTSTLDPIRVYDGGYVDNPDYGILMPCRCERRK